MDAPRKPTPLAMPLASFRALLVALVLLMPASCAWLPADGPDKSALLGDAAAQQGMVLAEVSPTTVATLGRESPPSFSGSFPNYRPGGQQLIGVGDAVRVTLWEAGPGGLFSTPPLDQATQGSRAATLPEQVVAADGAITVPYAGRIVVRGKTPPQVEEIIVARLTNLAIKPQALVSVVGNISNTATVMGEVRNGGRIPLTLRGDRLLEVIAAAGGITAPVPDTIIRLTRGRQTVSVPMQVLLQQPAEDVFAQPGDVITLARQPQSFMMFGAVQRTGQIPFEKTNISLADALARAGGLLTERADPAGLFVLRYESAALAGQIAMPGPAVQGEGPVPVIYHLNMRDPMAMLLARQLAMRDNDIVYVADSPLTDVQKVLGMFQLLTTPAVTAAAVKSTL